MKKLIILLGLIAIGFFITPRVCGIDKDVGFSFVSSVDHNAIVPVLCQADMNFSAEHVFMIAVRDPGDMHSEADRIINMQTAPPSGYLYDILTNYKTFDYTRIKDRFTGYIPYIEVVSTSNGGAGY
jgi:hypothetical protein